MDNNETKTDIVAETLATAALAFEAPEKKNTTRNRKPSVKKPKAEAKTPVEAKPKVERFTHASTGKVKNTYTGASGLMRARKADARVMADRSVGKMTDRDMSFNRDIKDAYPRAQFAGADFDAGGLSRLIAHGCLTHVKGTGTLDAGYIVGGQYQMTDKGRALA